MTYYRKKCKLFIPKWLNIYCRIVIVIIRLHLNIHSASKRIKKDSAPSETKTIKKTLEPLKEFRLPLLSIWSSLPVRKRQHGVAVIALKWTWVTQGLPFSVRGIINSRQRGNES